MDNIEHSNVPVEKIKKKFFVPDMLTKKYAKSYVNPMWSTNYNYNNVGTKFTNAQLTTLLQNPVINYKSLQEASNYFWSTSTFYQNIVYYFATLMTYDGILTPTSMTDGVKTMENRLLTSAKTIKNMKIKTLFPHLITRALLNGEAYFYEYSDDNENIEIQEIPSKYCQLAYIDDTTGQWKYYVNLSLLTEKSLEELPREIILAYQKYNKLNNKQKKEKHPVPELDDMIVPNNMYLISNRGFAIFVHKNKTQHDYPFFASMFVDINTMEDNKAYIDEYLKDSNIKLVHQKIPTDKETGEPLMDADDVSVYHESAKEHLPSSTAPLTNPFEVQSLNFDSVQASAINVQENSRKICQFDSGVSSTLFESNTTNGLTYSIEVDASKIYGLTSFLDNYMNFKIAKQKMKCTILHIHQYNRLEWHKQYATEMALGGSRSLFMATSGIDLYDYLMISKMEIMLDFDKYLPIKMNANQMSGDTGRPSIDSKDKADSTVIGEEYRNIADIFKLPNTPENVNTRNSIIRDYRQTMDIPENIGVNIADVIKWTENNDREG